MQTKTIKVCGVEASIEISSNAEEMNSLAGRDVCHDLACNYVDFHVFRGKVRTAVVNKLESLFPDNKRLTKTETVDGREVTKVDETDATYIARLRAGNVIDEASFDNVVRECIAATTWASCLQERERSAPSLPKKLAAIIDALAPEQRQKLAKKLTKQLGRDINPNDSVALGRGYQEAENKRREAELAAL